MSNPVADVGLDAPETGPADAVVPAALIEAAQPQKESWSRRRARLGDEEVVDVSVCIANWNCKDLLRACLQSLQEKTQDVRLEVIVADNDSSDGAAEMVACEFPEVMLHRNSSNLGFAKANNQAAEQARGRYLLFLNNDTVVPPGTLRRLIEFADRHPRLGILGPRLRDGEGRPQVSYRLRPTLATLLHRTSLLRWTGLLRDSYRRYRRQDFDSQTTRPVEVLMGAAMLLPRDVFFGCGGWDEEFTFGGEDLDLSARVGREHEILYHPQAEIRHFGRVSTRQHIGYVSTNMAAGLVRYLRKIGYRRPVVWLYKLVVTLDAPVQCVEKAAQYLWRRMRGEQLKAEKSRLACLGFAHFIGRGLPSFWRA
jgi:N-acetylglucosaminyl-diphospho-decaprenol L-rhamnosyltransferase